MANTGSPKGNMIHSTNISQRAWGAIPTARRKKRPEVPTVRMGDMRIPENPSRQPKPTRW